MSTLPRRFHLQRDTDITGVSGTGRVADGVLWPDGTVSLRWRGDRPSTVHWDRVADAEHVHGHHGATRIVWDDEAVHLGAGTNAEDCPACAGTNPPYPFICPGPGANARPTRYVVNLLPESEYAKGGHHFEITVEWRGEDRWAVLRSGWCLGADGDWDYERRPSEREDDWIAAHRFDLRTALRLAKEAAPTVTVNGVTAADAVARLAGEGA